MKTTKLLLLVATMAIATFAVAQTRSSSWGIQVQEEPHPSICITINTAMQFHGLVNAMYNQVNPSILEGEQQYYIVSVKYNHTVYIVSGSLSQWQRFFQKKPRYKALKKDE